jgi:hypothetical protein
LGLIVRQDGLQVDPKKVVAMKDWLSPKKLNILWGFLGIIGYYWKFVKIYGKIVAPLTSQKNN